LAADLTFDTSLSDAAFSVAYASSASACVSETSISPRA